MVISPEQDANAMPMVQLMPLPPHSCFIKIQIGLTFLLPAYPGCHGKEVVKRMSAYLFILLLFPYSLFIIYYHLIIPARRTRIARYTLCYGVTFVRLTIAYVTPAYLVEMATDTAGKWPRNILLQTSNRHIQQIRLYGS